MRVSPDKLSFFGGHVEVGETFEEAAERELKEETSIKDYTAVYVEEFTLEAYDGPDKSNQYYLYKMDIPDANFKVYEGVGAEIYSKEEALQRSDLSNSAQYALENYF